MAKEKVYIVLSHINMLKKDPRTGKHIKGEWEVSEKVEFVSQLRKRHTEESTAIADYLECKMLSGTRYGINDYNEFLSYVRKKYPKQLSELESLYKDKVKVQESTDNEIEEVIDQFGNKRQRTVFDVL